MITTTNESPAANETLAACNQAMEEASSPTACLNRANNLPVIPDFTKSDFKTHMAAKWLYKMSKTHSKPVIEELTVQLDAMTAKYNIVPFSLDFEDEFKKYALKDKSELIERKSGTNMTQFTNLPSHVCNMGCGNFFADDGGICSTDKHGNLVKVCNHPITVARNVVNKETGAMQVLLWARINGQDMYRLVDAGDLASARKLIVLRKYGFDIDESNASQMIRYFKALTMSIENYPLIQTKESISHCGYVGDNYAKCIPYDTTYEFDGDPTMQALFNVIQNPKGSKEDQMALFKRLRRDYPEAVRIVLSASLASLLLKPLGQKVFFLQIVGSKDTGKTTLLEIAASMFADPNAKGEYSYIRNFGATSAGCEILASFLGSLPVCLDETMTVSGFKSLDEFIYQMAQGQSKTRATKNCSARLVRTWHNVFIVTGERSAVTDHSKEGARIRVTILDLGSKPIFGSEVRDIHQAIAQNYGWIGCEFAQMLSTPGKLEEAEQLHRAYVEELAAAGYGGKQALSAAVILTADTLASKYVFKDPDESLRLTARDIIPCLASAREKELGFSLACFLKGVIAANPGRFLANAAGVPFSFYTELWGKRMGDGKLAFMQPALKKVLLSNGYEPESDKILAKWAKENDCISMGKDGNLFKNVNYPNGQVRSLVIDLDKIDTTSDEEDDANMDELPYPDSDDTGVANESAHLMDAAQTKLEDFQRSADTHCV